MRQASKRDIPQSPHLPRSAHPTRSSRPSGIRRTGAAVLAGALGFALTIAPSPAVAEPVADSDAGFRFDLPEPSGPYSIGTTELHLVDEDRTDPWGAEADRELMTSVWYPAKRGPERERAAYMHQEVGDELFKRVELDPGTVDVQGTRTSAITDAPLDRSLGERPVVLYSPGFGSVRGLGTVHVQELASQGYVVVTMDHTGEAPVRFPDGHVDTDRVGDFSPEAIRTAVEARVADARFVLDRLEEIQGGDDSGIEGGEVPRGLEAGLDLENIGMFGHSMGGATSIHTMYEDERVDAGIDLDGTVTSRQDDGEFEKRFPVALEGLDRPFMFMGGSSVEEGGERAPHTHRTFDDWGDLWDNSPGWKLDINFPQARHMSFTDLQLTLPQLEDAGIVPEGTVRESLGDAPDRPRLLRSQNAYITAFFDEHLKHEPQPILDGESPEHPDARFID
ncbi:alpha/beta hydrolase family protein [Nocardiopsis gilva]|uniref:alpha/beta hydrolase family protein n=1 Tax=Nocardiopsis gilva TaxID=280236 RepID=UPI0012687BE3|nr:hypothetical protein [Nocardiopsis gilva]